MNFRFLTKLKLPDRLRISQVHNLHLHVLRDQFRECYVNGFTRKPKIISETSEWPEPAGYRRVVRLDWWGIDLLEAGFYASTLAVSNDDNYKESEINKLVQ